MSMIGDYWDSSVSPTIVKGEDSEHKSANKNDSTTSAAEEIFPVLS
jgi:hypothetical protein